MIPATLTASPLQPQSLNTSTSRIRSIDILRGAVMVIMALDHARDFWSPATFRPEDVTQASVLLFFTRWVTHFCAPTFVFLSGISIYLQSRRINNLRATSAYLLKRGLWFILVEIFVITFLTQFSYNLVLIQVIWVIGWGMIFMAALIWCPRWAVLGGALIIIAGHNLFSDITPVTSHNFILAVLHNSPFIIQPSGLPTVLFAYALVPWVAVMAAGYAVGAVCEYDAPKRNTLLRNAGIVSLVLFVVIRGMNAYGDPAPWAWQERGGIYTVLSFLNVSKYPPSLLFLLLTVGVALLVLSFADRLTGRVVDWVSTFGEVPFFYFLLHIPILSGGAILWTLARYKVLAVLAFLPSNQLPPGYEPSLVRAYGVWLAVVVLLYFPCRWYARYKKSHRQAWLTYL